MQSGTLKEQYSTGGKRPTTLSTILYKQQANPLLSMHNYTPLVISGNDKNKQITLLSQRKLALTARNTLFVLKNHWSNKKIKKRPRPLRHQKPNLSRETVPLRGQGV
jgi:hypothetical protein